MFYVHSQLASMLREHGAQRPTIFEILNNVHRLRGTKSRFTYTIPEQAPLSSRSMNVGGAKAILDDLVTYKPQPPVPAAAKNNGTQAREKVLEAIAPMRRGRPGTSPAPRSRSTSPLKEPAKSKIQGSEPNPPIPIDKDQTWKFPPKDNGFIRGHKSGLVTSGAWKVKPPVYPDPGPKGKSSAALSPGFENDFLTNGFGDSFGGSPLALDFSSDKPKATPISIPKPQPSGVLPTSQEPLRIGISRSYKAKDAFEGLGLAEKPPAPTLAEARTARTGPALPFEQSFTPRRLSPKPPPSPKPRPLPSLSQPISENVPAEERFPSIEDLDRMAGSKPGSTIGSSQSATSKGTIGALRPPTDIPTGFGSRSQTVTGTSMQGKRDSTLGEIPNSQVTGRLQSSRPLLGRYTSTTSYSDLKDATDSLAGLLSRPPAATTSSSSQDWLTGDDQENVDILSRFNTSAGGMPGVDGNPGEPVLRDSPSKRASFIEKSPHLIAQPLEGNVEQIVLSETALPSTLSSSTSPAVHSIRPGTNKGARPPEINGDATVKGTGLSDNWSPLSPVMPEGQLPRKPSAGSVSSDDGPEDPDGVFGTLKKLRKSGQKKADVSSKQKRRQSSVHDLVDLWGGSNLLEKDKDKRNKPEPETNRPSFFPSGPDSSTLAGLTGLPRSSSPTHAPFQYSTPEKTTSSRFISPATDPQRKPTSTTVAPRMVNQISRPSSSSKNQSQPRSRPQSMLIFPSSKSIGGENGLPSPSLAVPLDKEGVRTISRSRRTSITDMVQRYEGVGVSVTNSPSFAGMTSLSPSVPPKSTGVRPHQNESQNVGSSHTRFIKVSPTNSPVIKQGLSLNVPEDDKIGRPGSRTSPTHKASPSRSPIELGRSSSSQSTQQLSRGDDPSEPKSPSPERPYVGVTKLIDQWQKKAEESNPASARKPGGIGAKRFGVGVGGGR